MEGKRKLNITHKEDYTGRIRKLDNPTFDMGPFENIRMHHEIETMIDAQETGGIRDAMLRHRVYNSPGRG